MMISTCVYIDELRSLYTCLYSILCSCLSAWLPSFTAMAKKLKVKKHTLKKKKKGISKTKIEEDPANEDGEDANEDDEDAPMMKKPGAKVDSEFSKIYSSWTAARRSRWDDASNTFPQKVLMPFVQKDYDEKRDLFKEIFEKASYSPDEMALLLGVVFDDAEKSRLWGNLDTAMKNTEMHDQWQSLKKKGMREGKMQ